MFSISKCKDKGAFRARLEKPRDLDLNKIKSLFNVIVETPYFLIVERDGYEIIVHKHGELLFKDCDDEAKMKALAGEVYSNA